MDLSNVHRLTFPQRVHVQAAAREQDLLEASFSMADFAGCCEGLSHTDIAALWQRSKPELRVALCAAFERAAIDIFQGLAIQRGQSSEAETNEWLYGDVS